MHYICNLLTYGHEICTAGASDMDGLTDRFTPSFPGSHGQNVKKQFLGNYGGTNRNPYTQSLIILRAPTY